MSRWYKKYILLILFLVLSVGCIGKINLSALMTVSASTTWNSYFGASAEPSWYEGAEGNLTTNKADGFTANMSRVGWGGIWGAQAWRELDDKIIEGEEYTLSFKIHGTNVKKYVYICIGDSLRPAYSMWVCLLPNKSYTIIENFIAKAGADKVWFGFGGDFGNREDTVDDLDAAYRYAVFTVQFQKNAQSTLAAEDANGDSTAVMNIAVSNFELKEKIKEQTITAKSKKVSYGTKSFNLNAITNGNGKLTYASSNSRVAVVNESGKVAIKGCGKTTITIKACETEGYTSALKKITIEVVPKKVTINKIKSPGKKKMTAVWKKVSGITGYQIYFSTRKNFKRDTYVRTYKMNKTKMNIIALKSKKTYYMKIRAYKKIGKEKYYGAWSKVRSVKIK